MDVQLYQGDCLDIMRGMPDNSVDAVITDPPFGIGFAYNSYDDNASSYSALMAALVRESERLVSNGFIFIWQAMLNAEKWHQWFPSGYRIFAGIKNFTQYRPTPVQYSWDPVIFWEIGNSGIKGVAGQRDYHVGNTAKWVTQKNNGHPCPRPLDTVQYIVQLATKAGDTILDPFMGSGTTGVACVQTGRNFIGIEIDERYYEIAQKRIAEAQPALFG